MASKALENLEKTGKLKAEPPTQDEIDGLIRSGAVRLKDAQNPALSPESRFDLAYNAAHALALAALRFSGYRSDARYLVFQCLQHTLGLQAAQWRVLDRAHEKRNRSEYEGEVELDEALIKSVIAVAVELERLVRALGPVPK